MPMNPNISEEKVKPFRLVKYFTFTSIIVIFLGGRMVVSGAEAIVAQFGLTEAFVGLTILAIGTSLPELITAGVAIRREKSDIAVGNVLGSNLFNILAILGLTALTRPMQVDAVITFDAIFVLISSMILIGITLLPKEHTLSRKKGIFLAHIRRRKRNL